MNCVKTHGWMKAETSVARAGKALNACSVQNALVWSSSSHTEAQGCLQALVCHTHFQGSLESDGQLSEQPTLVTSQKDCSLPPRGHIPRLPA